MLLQGRKVEVLPPDMSGDYEGGAGEMAQHFRTPTALGKDHIWVSQHPHWEAHSPTNSSSRRPSILFWPLQTPTPMCSHPCTDVHIHINKINLKKRMKKSNASSENFEFVHELRTSENLCTGEVDVLYVGPRSHGMPSGYKVPCASLKPPRHWRAQQRRCLHVPWTCGKRVGTLWGRQGSSIGHHQVLPHRCGHC